MAHENTEAQEKMNEFRQRMAGFASPWGHPGFGIRPPMPPPWGAPAPSPAGPPGPPSPPAPSLAEGLGTMIRLGLEALNSGLQALVGQPGPFAPPHMGGCGMHDMHGSGMPHMPHGAQGCCSCCMYSHQECCNPSVSSCGYCG
jgi:hypothetical protein